MKKKQIVILAVLLVVLAAVYGALSFQNEKAEKEEQAKEESQVIKVTELGEAVSFSFQAPDQEKLNFIKKDDKWICIDDEKIKLEQTYPDRIADTFSNLTASRKLEDIDELEDYGLEEPAYTVVIKTEEKEEAVIRIGNSTGEEYYLLAEGEKDVIYTVSSSVVESLNYSLEDMQEQEEETSDP